MLLFVCVQEKKEEEKRVREEEEEKQRYLNLSDREKVRTLFT